MPRPQAEVAAPAATPDSARQCPSSAHPPRYGVRLDLSLPLHAACSGVGALEVVVGDVLDQVALERGDLGDQGAGEAGSPALLEDGRLDSLDAAVGLRPAGPDEALLCTGGVRGRRNSWERNSEPLSVETACSCHRAAASSAATQRTRAEVWRAAGLRGVTEGGHVDLGWNVCKRLQELDKRVPDAQR
jgi:hypothetical protein